MNIVPVSPVVTAVLEALAAAGVRADIGLKPDDVPDDTGWVAAYPSTPTVSDDGSMAQPHEQDPLEIQLVFVGRTAEQATWVADKARAVLLAGAFTVPGRSVFWVEEVAGRPLQRDDDEHPPLYSIATNFKIRTTPA